VIFEFTEKLVNGELSLFFAFTRHKATSAAAILEGSVEISGSLRKGMLRVAVEAFRLELKKVDRF